MFQDSTEQTPGVQADPLAGAVAAVHQARQQLESLLEQTRHVYRSAFAAFRDVERRLKESGESPFAVADEQHSDGDRITSLRDSYAVRSDELVGLANAARRVETVMRQLDASEKYLLTAPDVVAIADPVAGPTQFQALELQEEERQRLAREIHDGPAQVLANAIFQMEFCLRLIEKDPVRLPGELARLKEDLREGLAETRYFIFDLRSDQLSEIGLIAVLRRYVDTYQSRFGIAAKFDAIGEVPRLMHRKELAVFRILQEALQNTRKHSGANDVSVELRAINGSLIAVVTDNGRGFRTDAVAGSSTRHYGLSSMRERAQLIGASLQITSEPGRGTRVTLRVPIDS